MTSYEELAANLPIDQIAARLGEDPAAVQAAVNIALPTLFGGLEANAQDAGGAQSLASALDAHNNDLADPPVDIDQVDTADGEAISRHIFGNNEEQVINQLGATGASSTLIKKLIPILAPIVLSYLAKQLASKGAGAGALGAILSTILAGAAQGAGGSSQSSAGSAMGSIFGDLLGGLLGGGRKA
ncbi:MAG: DUF937 domain-containing protein [Nocardioides sp.]|jgi:hypothetical protein